MFRTYRLGSLFGFPIEINLSFLLMLGAVLLWMGGLAGLFIVLLAFGSVVLHELGHALVARKLGVHVAGIELHFFGGAAKMAQQPKSARDEILIAAAGPAVSFALAGVAWLLFAINASPLFATIGWINLIIGGFNLVPALPMDGGRIFRAALSQRMSFVRATEIAVKVARGFAIALVVWGLATTQLYLLLLAWVLWSMGTAEQHMSRHFGYRQGGKRQSEVEVIPRGGSPAGGPFRRRGYSQPPSQFATDEEIIVRREGGRLIIETRRR